MEWRRDSGGVGTRVISGDCGNCGYESRSTGNNRADVPLSTPRPIPIPVSSKP
jgi:hypothetical protein